MKLYKDRPYIVCHVLSSVDGRISGSLFSADETMIAQSVYSNIRNDYNCMAVLNGTVTCSQIYADNYVSDLPKADKRWPHDDYVAATDLNKYVVCVDTEGTLKWHDNIVNRGGQRSYVIEILTDAVDNDYIAYLRSLGISYIFAGEKTFDVPLAMKKLKKFFCIDTLMITGGGIIDWSFLKAGMIDEVSLVVSPVVSAETGKATGFDQSAFVSDTGAVSLELADVKQYQEGILWLNYNVKERL